MELVENTDTSITRTEVSLNIEKRLVPIFNAPNPYVMKFGNELQVFAPGSSETTLTSSYFTYLSPNSVAQKYSFLEDNGQGSIMIYYIDSAGTKRITKSDLGTINYETGEVILTNFSPIASDLETHIKIIARPRYNNIIGERNQILIIDKNDPSSVSINMHNEVPYETSIRGTVGSTPQSFITNVTTLTSTDTTNEGVF